MANFYNRLKRGMTADAEPATPEEVPAQFSVEGIAVTCSHCGGKEFSSGTAQLNTAGMTFFHLDWADRTAHTLMCAHCGHIEWFAQQPTKQ